MFPFFLNVFLALTWAALMGDFGPSDILFGFLLGYFMLTIVQSMPGVKSYVQRVRKIIGFLRFFLWELITANILVAQTLILNMPKQQPGIIKIPLDIKGDIQITVLANMITLTPGTWALEVDERKEYIYVHCMYLDNAEQTRKGIKDGFERRIKELCESDSTQEIH